ncbi:MAG: hypothetical protein JJE49_03135 [Peptostreptococcaceae bacterium]|nr:hypothetical protein [Peptostreptococcaceae bacterium]
MCFGGIINASGMLSALAQAMLKFAKSTGSLVAITVFSCIFMNIIAADQYLSIIFPGRMYKEAFEDRKLAPKNLSRCLEDSEYAAVIDAREMDRASALKSLEA